MSKRLILLLLTVLLAVPISISAQTTTQQSGVWLGIYPQTVDKDLKEAFNLDADYGVIVKAVIPGSPADEAGIKQGDIILKFDGQKLSSADDLIKDVSEHNAGDKVDMVVVRDGEKKTVEANLENRENSDAYAQAKNNPNKIFQWFDQNAPNSPKSYSWSYQNDESEYANSYIGVSIQNLNPQLGEYFGVDDGHGALITEVMADSPAEKAGLKAGDVIVSIGGNEVEGPADVQKAVRKAEKGEELNIAVLRNKDEKDFTLEVAEAPDNFYSMPNMTAPDFDNNFQFLPRMKGLFHGNSDNSTFDAQDMQEWREEMQKEMKELRKEMQELKGKLE
jgi:C-terminal processing protease CtpA/Prc